MEENTKDAAEMPRADAEREYGAEIDVSLCLSELQRE
jgi:hypothetical protein